MLPRFRTCLSTRHDAAQTHYHHQNTPKTKTQPFRDFVQLPWWDVATNPDPGSDPAAFQAMLKGAWVREQSVRGLGYV